MFRIEEVRKNNRTGLLNSSFAAHIAIMILVLTVVLGPWTASARRPPTPTNFRVTTTTAYTVTLAWDPLPLTPAISIITSGALTMSGPRVILPKTATSYTFTALFPGNTYTFGIYAKNAAGNASAQATLSGIRPAARHDPAHYRPDCLHRRSRLQLRQALLDTRAGRRPAPLHANLFERRLLLRSRPRHHERHAPFPPARHHLQPYRPRHRFRQ